MGVVRTNKPFTVISDNRAIQCAVTGKERITGTTLAGIVGLSKYDTPFTASCKILGLVKIEQNDSMRFGVYAEPLIFAELKRRGYSAFPASEVYGGDVSAYESYEAWPSHWDNPIFGGHLDGIDADGDIWEIKTTSNLSAWIGDATAGTMTPPEYYHIQASLYAMLEGCDKIHFAVAPITPTISRDPRTFDPTKSDALYVVDVGLYPGMEQIIERAGAFYRDYISKGITPEPDFADDRDMDVVRELFTRRDDPDTIIQKYARTHGELERLKNAFIKDLEAELDDLKKEIKEKTDFSDASVCVEYKVDGNLWKISKTYRRSLSEAMLIADGIDAEKYKETTESLRIDKRKVK